MQCPLRLVLNRAPRVALLILPFILPSPATAGQPGERPPAAKATEKLDRAAVRRELQDFSPAEMDRRLGPDYAFYHHAQEKFPEVWMAPAGQDPGGRPYQIGGPWVKEAGDFSSTQGKSSTCPTAAFSRLTA